MTTTATPKLTKTGATFTTAWKSANGHDLKKGDRFTTKDGTVSGTVAGRFTKPGKDGSRVPHISCDDAGDKCFRAPAADLIHVDPAAKPKRIRKPANKVVTELQAAVDAGVKTA